MDFGALVSLKNPDKIDWDDYPLKGCEFAKTKGGEENSKFKIQNSK